MYRSSVGWTILFGILAIAFGIWWAATGPYVWGGAVILFWIFVALFFLSFFFWGPRWPWPGAGPRGPLPRRGP